MGLLVIATYKKLEVTAVHVFEISFRYANQIMASPRVKPASDFAVESTADCWVTNAITLPRRPGYLFPAWGDDKHVVRDIFLIHIG